MVTLTGHLVDARMPTRSRMWSLSFRDERARDDSFAWLAERVVYEATHQSFDDVHEHGDFSSTVVQSLDHGER